MTVSNAPFIPSTAEPADQDYAQQYSADFVSRWDELIDWHKRAVGEKDFFVKCLAQMKARRVLDVATGSGFHAVQLRSANFSVTACDGSQTMVDRARDNFERRGLRIPLYQCDWANLAQLQRERKLEPFDAVLCLGSSLCHLFDKNERINVLRQFRGLLKPGGTLLIDQRNFDAILAGYFKSSGQYYYCGKTAQVTLGKVNDSLCEFIYTFADRARYRLRVFPIRPEDLSSELSAAGFTVEARYGDFKRLYDPLRADFIIHQASA